MGKETTRNTAATPTIYMPIAPGPTLTPSQAWEKDEHLRGSPVALYDDVPTTRFDSYECKGNVFADTFPVHMLGLLGGPDTTSGTSAPVTHTIQLLNAAESGSQPPSYTIVDVDLVEESGTTDNAKQMTGGQIDSVDVNFAATGALNYSAKYIGNPFTEVAKPASPAFSSELFIPGYNCVVTIGGTSVAVLSEGSFTMQRSTASIFTMGSSSPYQNWASVINVTGKLTFLVIEDDATMANGLEYLHQTLKFVFTEKVSNHTVTFQFSDVQFVDPVIDRSKPQVYVSTNFNAHANATDAASGGGYSPMLFEATNAQTAAY